MGLFSRAYPVAVLPITLAVTLPYARGWGVVGPQWLRRFSSQQATARAERTESNWDYLHQVAKSAIGQYSQAHLPHTTAALRRGQTVPFPCAATVMVNSGNAIAQGPACELLCSPCPGLAWALYYFCGVKSHPGTGCTVVVGNKILNAPGQAIPANFQFMDMWEQM